MSNSRKTKAIVLVALLGLVGAALLWSRAKEPTGAAPGRRAARAPAPTLFAPEPDLDPSQSAAAVEGTLRSADGAPVDGATVVLTRRRARETPWTPVIPTGVTTTAGGGRFRFDRVAPGRYAVTATAPRNAPAQKEPVEVAERATVTVDLALGRGGLLLHGRVLDVGGGVIPGAIVRAFDLGGITDQQTRQLFQASTDESGTYRLPLRRGRFQITVDAQGYGRATHVVYLARDTRQDLRLMPAARVAGRVVDRSTRQPVAEAEVWLAQDGFGGMRPRDVRTDLEGAFVFTEVEAGAYRPNARKGRLVGVGRQIAVGVAQALEGIIVEVDAGLVVRGRVSRDGGGAIEGARVDAFKFEPPFERPQFVSTGKDGSYELGGLLPGRYDIGATADGHARVQRTLSVSRDIEGVDFVLPAGARVAGRVEDGAGKGVAGAHVAVRVRPPGPMRGWVVGRGISDGDGRFEIGELEAGALHLEADHPSGNAAIGPEDLASGEKKVVKVVLETGASISGVVRFHDGAPAPDVQVSALPRTSRVNWTAITEVTGPDGRYTLRPLRAGQTIVTASPKGEFLTQETLEAPDRRAVSVKGGEALTGIDLVVRRGGHQIAGTVVDPEGRPVLGATVGAVPEREARLILARTAVLDRAVTADDGSFALDDLDADKHTLWVAHPEYPDLQTKGVTGGSKGVRLRMRRQASLSGTVVAQDGRPSADFSVVLLEGPKPGETPEQRQRRQLFDSFGRPTQRVREASGAFAFHRLDAGSYELRVSAADGALGSMTVTVAEGEQKKDLRIQLEAGVTLSGRFVDYGSGRPIPGMEVQVYAPGGFSRTSAADGEGRFTVEGLPSGQTATIVARTDPRIHVNDYRELDIPTGKSEIDAGTIRLVRGDFEAKMAELERAGRGSTGILGICRNGRTSISGVEQGLPGAKAGIQVGDRVLTIDGKDARDIGGGAFRYFTIGKVGTELAFELEPVSGGGVRKVTVIRVARNR